MMPPLFVFRDTGFDQRPDMIKISRRQNESVYTDEMQSIFDHP